MADDDYLDRALDFRVAVRRVVPEVVPEHRYHDGWDGASGCELTSDMDTTYMPFPHPWDYTLDWCQIRTWSHIMDNTPYKPGCFFTEIHPDLISGWVYMRAIGYDVGPDHDERNR